MSDAVLLSLINTLGIIAAGIISFLNNRQINKVNSKVDDNTRLTNEVNHKVEVVKTQTDGMNDQLVKVSGLLGEAVGNKAGRAEQKAETDNAIVTEIAPLKVEVVNQPLKVDPIDHPKT